VQNLWLDKKQPEDKKISHAFCARKNTVRLRGRRKIIRFHQRNAVDKREIYDSDLFFVEDAV
jgi:hypothetical protein